MNNSHSTKEYFQYPNQPTNRGVFNRSSRPWRRLLSLCCKSLQRGSNLDLLLINSMNWVEVASFVKANVDEKGKASGFAHE